MPKSHRDHARQRSAAVGAVGALAVSIQGLTIHFRKPLGRAQHRDRVDRLIGRDHHHRLSPGAARGVSDVDRAKHVGLDALLPIALQKRYVFERGGMENKTRLAIGDQFKDSIAIADIGDASVNYRVARFDRQSLEDCVQCRF